MSAVLKSAGRQKVAIFLRRSAAINRFRGILVDCLAKPSLSEAVVASGFFQEGPKFSGASIFSVSPTRCGSPLDLIFVGVHNPYWTAQFNSFVASVESANCALCIKVTKRMPKGLRWHAKTFIGSVKGVPRVGIIGSSNITRPAADTSTPFNYEADVVLWHEDDKEINATVTRQFENLRDGSHEVIVTTYESGGPNGQLTLEERLQSLREEIISSSKAV
jgi:hypothetical protein